MVRSAVAAGLSLAVLAVAVSPAVGQSPEGDPSPPPGRQTSDGDPSAPSDRQSSEVAEGLPPDSLGPGGALGLDPDLGDGSLAAGVVYPNLGSQLSALAVASAAGGESALGGAALPGGAAVPGDAAGGAAVPGDAALPGGANSTLGGEPLLLTVQLDGNRADVVDFLADNGVSPSNVVGDYLEVYVPPELLGSLAQQTGVSRVREMPQPFKNQHAATVEAVSDHGAAAWHKSGLTGGGVKVGVIDTLSNVTSRDGFTGLRALRGTELPSTVVGRCYTDVGTPTSDLANCDAAGGSRHGTKVAGALMDIAPDAELYVSNPKTWADLQSTVEWMHSQGVTVIVYSVGWSFHGAGDGTSPITPSPLNTAKWAADNGIIWVNSAGNYAKRGWLGAFADSDDDGYHEWDGTGSSADEAQRFWLNATSYIYVNMRWDDVWGGSTKDLDIEVRYSATIDGAQSVVATAADVQNGGSTDYPSERLRLTVAKTGYYWVHVKKKAASAAPSWVQFFVYNRQIDHYTAGGSVTSPADSSSPGVLAVGAAGKTRDGSFAIKSYSSRGPTPDGRTKPDIVALDCEPAPDENRTFCGTSQSAPFVAGLAALVRERYPAYTPQQVADYLKTNAADLGAAGADNTWGHGLALLPSDGLPPTISISGGAEVVEGSAAEFTLTADPKPPAGLPVTFSVAQDGDFGVAAGTRTVTVPVSGSAVFSVATVRDTVIEPDGSVTVTVEAGADYTPASAPSATVAVTDGNGPPTVSVTEASAMEGEPLRFEVKLSHPYSESVGVVYITVGGSAAGGATSGSDFEMSNDWIDFLPLETSKIVEVPTLEDDLEEGEEVFVLELPYLENAANDRASAIGTITDFDDAAPVVSISGGSDVAEGTTASFTLAAVPAPSADLPVSVLISAAGEFGVVTGVRSVTIPASGRVMFAVPTVGDSVDETDGFVAVAVRGGNGYRVSSIHPSGRVAVMDADGPPSGASVVSITAGPDVTEGGDVEFTVTAVPAPAADLPVTVTITADGDYSAVTGTRRVTVSTGGSVSFTVATSDDSVDELDGSVTATVNTGSGYTVSNAQGAGTVAVSDDDDPSIPVVGITAGPGVTEGGDASFTLTASPAPAADLPVTVTITADGDYGAVTGSRTVTVPTGGSVSFTVATTDDSVDELDGSVTATVNGGSGYTVSATQGTGTVAVSDDDDPSIPVVSITAGPGVTEGGDASFTLTASPAPAADLPVTVTITADGDYGAVTGSRTVTVPTGGSVSFTVATTDDSVDELDGSVTATVNGGSGYTVSATQGTGTVNVSDDDDAPTGPVLGAQLEADVRSYAAEVHHGALHVTRWKRVLEAFGLEDYAGLVPTTLDEARVHVDIGRPRWVPVLAHMVALDAVNPQPPPARGSVQVDAQVLATARSKAAETYRGVKHVNRWKRVLEAFGDSDYPGVEPLTAAGAQVYANVWSGWDQVAAQLRLIEAAATADPPPVVPVVSILSSAGGTEGVTVSFTLTAAPAPAADLDVDVSVVTSGDFGYGPTPVTVTIPTGGTATVSIATTGDSTDEPDGTVTLTVDAGSGYTVGANASGSVDVTDDDDPVAPVVIPDPQVSITAGPGVTEGGAASFTLTAVPAPAADLPVTVTVSQSGAFGASTGSRTVTVPSGGSVSFTVATTDDSVDETDGSVTVTVNTGSGYTVSNTQGAGTVAVADNDVPQVSITAGPGVTEGGAASFTLTAVPAPAADLPVTVTVSQSGAFGAVTGSRTVTVPSGGSVSFTVATTDDSADELDGSVTVTVNTGSGYTVSNTQGTGTVAVSDDDDPPIPVVSITAGPGVTEGGAASFTLTAVPAPAADLSVTVTVSQNGAFGAPTGPRTVTVPSGGSVSFTVATTDDSADETDGSVTVTVNGGSGYTVSNTQGAGTVAVADNDVPQVSITAGPGVTEGGAASFTLTAAPAPAADLPVTVTVSQNGAFGAPTGSRTVTVPSGGSVSFTVATTDDSADELDGSVTVTVNTGSGYTVSNTQGAGTVAVSDDDDPLIPVVSITAGPGVTEGTSASFTLTAAPAPAADLPVTVTVSQSGAFGAVTGSRTVTVPSGGSVSFTVATTDDSVDELDGSVTATVNTGSGYTVSNTQGAGTVNVSDDDDPPIPVVSITAGPGVTEGTSASFTLTAAPAPTADLPVTVTVSQSGAFGAVTGSRTVTVPTTGSVTLTIGTSDDSVDELDGSVTVTVNTGGGGYTVSNTQGTGTVNVADNDDPPPVSSVTVSVEDAAGSEGSWAVDFTVRLSEASSEEVRVRFTTWNWRGLTGRAHMWLDYQTRDYTVVFTPGQTEQTVTVWLIDDYRSEPDEYFTVELTNPRGATIEDGKGAATGTITDDD